MNINITFIFPHDYFFNLTFQCQNGIKLFNFLFNFFLLRCRLNRLFPFNLVSLHAMQVTETHLELSICSSHMSWLIPWHLFLSFHGKTSNLYCNILKCRTLESGNTLNSHRKFPRNFRLQQCWWKSPQRCCDTGQCFQYHKQFLCYWFFMIKSSA